MSWSIGIGRIAGTAVRIHLTFFLLLGWIWLDAYFRLGLSEASSAVIFIVLVFVCVLLHEFGHILTARFFGVPTPDVTLYPFGGIARLSSIPEIPRQEFLIAAAGPAVNVVIAAVLVLIAGATIDPEALANWGTGAPGLATQLAAANIILAVFNLIPAFPMDGGRLLRAVLSSQFGFARATQLAARIGQFIAVLLGLLGLFYNPMLIVIAIFVYLAAGAEAQSATIRTMSSDIPVSRAMMTKFATLPMDARIADAVDILLRSSQRFIPVLDHSGALAGVIEMSDVVRALHEPVPDQRVSSIMTTDVPMLDQSALLSSAFRLLQEGNSAVVGIRGRDSRLAGLVTTETLGEMLVLHDASPALFDRMHLHRPVVGKDTSP